MIDKIRKGRHAAGLIRYLYGPGRSDEHTDPHIVAGWRAPPDIEPPITPDGKRDFRDLVNLLNAPLDLAGRLGQKDTVWHCVLSAAPDDPLLSDGQWNQIAAQFMHRMGLAPRDDPAGARWIAVRHGLSRDGIDHIHIVATLARHDGTLPSVHNDYLRARKACQEIETQSGLRATAAADRTAAVRPSRAETEQAIRNGRPAPPRATLRRLLQDTAASALSEQDFFARLGDTGALIRYRNSTTDPAAVTGYAVALPAGTAGTGHKRIWFSGGKLAPDLTLPRLRRRWEHTRNDRVIDHAPSADLSPRSVRAFLRSAACSAADQARDEHGFFSHLASAGVLIRYRYSDIAPGETTGYALSVPGHTDDCGDPLWYSGGRLAASLTLPRLRQHWDKDPRQRISPSLSPAERNAIWDDFIRITSDGADTLRRLAQTDPAAASDAAWATADVLRVSALALPGASGRQISRAAEDFDRAARETYRVTPRPAPAGDSLRTASRLLAILRTAASPGARFDVLVANLARLASAVADLRRAQERAHQAEAAKTAAQRLNSINRDAAIRPQPPARKTAPAESAPAPYATENSPLRLSQSASIRPQHRPPGNSAATSRNRAGPEP